MMIKHIDAARALVMQTLTEPRRHEWTLQGFGMLRTYLPDGWRLHVWNDAYQVPGVTLLHDHPWHFESLVIVGCLMNQRYHEGDRMQPATHMQRTIKPGIGLQVLEDDKPVVLQATGAAETYLEGEIYAQRADEIHSTRAMPGTVTLVRRTRVGADVARSFYPANGQWVSGEPKVATADEVLAICGQSLKTWFRT